MASTTRGWRQLCNCNVQSYVRIDPGMSVRCARYSDSVTHTGSPYVLLTPSTLWIFLVTSRASSLSTEHTTLATSSKSPTPPSGSMATIFAIIPSRLALIVSYICVSIHPVKGLGYRQADACGAACDGYDFVEEVEAHSKWLLLRERTE